MCAPQNGIISHIITYYIIYHENPDLSTSFSIFLPFFYLFRHLSETARRKRRFLCILRCAWRLERLDLNFKMCIKDLFTSARSVKHQKENLRQEVLFFIFTLRFQPHLLRKPPSLQPQIPIRLCHLLRLP